MGKATINSGGQEGKYSISLDYGTEKVNGELARIDTRIDEIETKLTERGDELDDAKSAQSSASISLDIAIGSFKAAPEDESDKQKKAVDKATETLLDSRATGEVIERAIATLTLEKTKHLSRKSQLQALDLTESRQAWCIDYTVDAIGDVSTLELNGEQPGIVISPGGEPPDSADGELRHRMAMSGPAAFYNAAILPGWQKFSPTYRAGEILSINKENDTCSINLDSATSSAQNLNINQSDSLSAVPIKYMTCNSGAFEKGDKVVVEFQRQDWSDPRVIGFVSNPRPCEPRLLFVLTVDSSSNTVVRGPYDPSRKVQNSTDRYGGLSNNEYIDRTFSAGLGYGIENVVWSSSQAEGTGEFGHHYTIQAGNANTATLKLNTTGGAFYQNGPESEEYTWSSDYVVLGGDQSVPMIPKGLWTGVLAFSAYTLLGREPYNIVRGHTINWADSVCSHGLHDSLIGSFQVEKLDLTISRGDRSVINDVIRSMWDIPQMLSVQLPSGKTMSYKFQSIYSMGDPVLFEFGPSGSQSGVTHPQLGEKMREYVGVVYRASGKVAE